MSPSASSAPVSDETLIARHWRVSALQNSELLSQHILILVAVHVTRHIGDVFAWQHILMQEQASLFQFSPEALGAKASAVSEQPDARIDTDFELLWSRCRALMVFHAGALPTACGLPGLPRPGLACGPLPCCEADALAAASSALIVSAAGVVPMLGLPALLRLTTAGLERHTAPAEATLLFAAAAASLKDGCDEAWSARIATGKLHMPLMVCAGRCAANAREAQTRAAVHSVLARWQPCRATCCVQDASRVCHARLHLLWRRQGCQSLPSRAVLPIVPGSD